jgi:F-type H+-transporting ATPase subunit gamma
MSTALRELRRRIRSTRQVHKVTSALQRVSAARLRNDRRAAEAIQHYRLRQTDALSRLAAGAPGLTHPLLQWRPKPGCVGVALFGSDRGLCGGFNSDLVARFESLRAECGPVEWRPVTVGNVMERRVRRLGLRLERARPQPPAATRDAELGDLAAWLTDLFARRACDAVYLVYARFVSASRYEPVAERLLPAPISAREDAPRLVRFEPAPEAILARLLPEAVRTAVEHAFLNSVAAEQAARQNAMSRAAQNALDMLEELVVQYSRQRQESITTEVIELVGGGTA